MFVVVVVVAAAAVTEAQVSVLFVLGRKGWSSMDR